MHRTFPDNILFKNKAEPGLQKELFNVLLAYGHHNPTVGYCQVMKNTLSKRTLTLLSHNVYLKNRTSYLYMEAFPTSDFLNLLPHNNGWLYESFGR